MILQTLSWLQFVFLPLWLLIFTPFVILPLVSFHAPNIKKGPLLENIRLMYANVLTSNTTTELLGALLPNTQPDLVVVLEVDSRWIKDLKGVRGIDKLSYRIEIPRSDNFGMALFSRCRLTSLKRQPVSPPVIAQRVTCPGRIPFLLLGVHLLPPINSINYRISWNLVGNLIQMIESSSDPVLLVGDLNSTIYGGLYQELIQHKLRDLRIGKGLSRTWKADSWIFRLAIDHILATKEIIAESIEVGPFIGSDHFPLVGIISLPSMGDKS